MQFNLSKSQEHKRLESELEVLKPKIETEKKIKGRIQAFMILLQAITSRIIELINTRGGAVQSHANEQVMRLKTGISTNPMKEQWLGGIYSNLKKRFAASSVGRFTKELAKIFSRNPTDFHTALALINETWNLWRAQQMWEKFMTPSTFFAIILIHTTIAGETKTNAVKTMDRWLFGLEQALLAGSTQEQYEAEHKDLLECLRDFATTTEREEASGAVYDKKTTQKSGDTKEPDKQMKKKDQVKEIQRITGRPKGEVEAMLATPKENPGKKSGKSGGDTKDEQPELPDKLKFEGAEYHNAPAPLKYKYTQTNYSRLHSIEMSSTLKVIPRSTLLTQMECMPRRCFPMQLLTMKMQQLPMMCARASVRSVDCLVIRKEDVSRSRND